MKTNEKIMLSRMIALAAEKHKDVLDKSGVPYILHPVAVMNMLNTDDYELMQIAVGHDLIEDTDVTETMLCEMGFSDRVVKGIVAMSKNEGEHFDIYKHRVLSNMDSCKVKLCDLRHNSDVRRLIGLTEKDFQRTKKYMEFHEEIKQHLTNIRG